jgi:hypothetical protein
MGTAKGRRAQKWLLPQVASATGGFLPTGFLPKGLLPRREATAAMWEASQTRSLDDVPKRKACLGEKASASPSIQEKKRRITKTQTETVLVRTHRILPTQDTLTPFLGP